MQSVPQKVIKLPAVRGKIHVFADRRHAGEILGESIHKVADRVDAVTCPNIRSGLRFAVADAYQYRSDVTEEALQDLLKEGQGLAPR